MRKPRVLVTRKLPDIVERRLSRDYEAFLNPTDTIFDFETLIEHASGKDAILICASDIMSDELINKLPNSIRIIATFSVGYEHINLSAASNRGIIITNTPGVLDYATADLTILLMLGACRRAAEGIAMIKEGRWETWSAVGMLGTDFSEKRLGIFGMGNIGRAVATRAKAFNIEVHYHSRNQLNRELENGVHFHSTPESLLQVSEIFSLHAPLNSETRHFLSKQRIDCLPDQAIVINAARGDLVVDEDLIAALKSGKIAAAGLDVFSGEPNIHPEYLKLPNTFLLPHMGSATIETRVAMGFRALDNIDAVFEGLIPPNGIA